MGKRNKQIRLGYTIHKENVHLINEIKRLGEIIEIQNKVTDRWQQFLKNTKN